MQNLITADLLLSPVAAETASNRSINSGVNFIGIGNPLAILNNSTTASPIRKRNRFFVLPMVYHLYTMET